MTAFESGNCPAGRPGVGERALPYGFRPDPESVIHVPLAGSRFLPFIQLQSLAHVGWLLAADVRLPDVESERFHHLWHDSQLHPPKPLSPTVAN